MIKQRQQFCFRIKKARLDARLKQEQVARYLNIATSAVSAIESGNRKVDALELNQLSSLYHKPLDWFFEAGFEPGEQRRGQPPLPEAAGTPGQEDPILQECMQYLRKAPPDLQRRAAYGLLGFLSDR
ncbi:MAG: helix-turn-helix domain-containing protein [Candidatus Melainabacteria bacterium]